MVDVVGYPLARRDRVGPGSNLDGGNLKRPLGTYSINEVLESHGGPVVVEREARLLAGLAKEDPSARRTIFAGVDAERCDDSTVPANVERRR